MALLEVLFGSGRKARVGVVQFDASVSEGHGKEAEVPDHPVEVGADISDHIRRKPETLNVNGIVTNHPIVFLASLNAPSPKLGELAPTEDRVEAAYSELRRVMDAGELVDAVTTLREYRNMAITSLQVQRDAANGNVLNAQLSLREIILASVERVDQPQPVAAAKNLGRKATTPADATTDAKAHSVLKGLTDFVGGAIFGP